eukprot:1191618-Prorocentrum_minimum.AAC.5
MCVTQRRNNLSHYRRYGRVAGAAARADAAEAAGQESQMADQSLLPAAGDDQPGRGASDWSVARIYLRLLRLIGLYPPCVRSMLTNPWTPSTISVILIPALPASDWSLVRIYPRFLHLIGPS